MDVGKPVKLFQQIVQGGVMTVWRQLIKEKLVGLRCPGNVDCFMTNAIKVTHLAPRELYLD